MDMNCLSVAIIDDCKQDQDRILGLVHSAFPKAACMAYGSCSEFLSLPCYCSLLLLDIEVGEEDGIRFSRDLSAYASFIVFVTSMKQCMPDAFAPKTVGFLLKTESNEVLIEKLREIRERYLQPSIHVQTDQGELELNPDMVQYISRVGRKIVLYMNRQQNYVLYHETIQSCMEKFPELCMINQSQLVNLNYIRKMENDFLMLFDGTVLYPSRRQRRKVQEAYLRRIV